MKKKLFILLIVCSSCCLFSFFTKKRSNPAEKLRSFYTEQFHTLSQNLLALKKAVATNSSTRSIQENFLRARLTYKQLELILSYYFEGDVNRFNGLAVNFVEEEDPAAYQDPQGFQSIESLLYPAYHQENRPLLLMYIDKLALITKGLGNNPSLFQPGNYIPDAIMEELYRITALGITGFDSPLAMLSLQETKSALGSIAFIATLYKDDWDAVMPGSYKRILQLLRSSMDYVSSNNNFNSFNRLVFIKQFLTPLCEAVGELKTRGHYTENPVHYSLISKTGSLFNEKSLNRNRYLYDDTVNMARAALGKKLFYEPLLSAGNQRSCAGCHQPGKAFTDGLPKALQLDGHSSLPRNTPTLWNAALQMNMFYDSRHTRLEDVVLEVLGNEKEMNSGAREAVKKLQQSASYRTRFGLVYGAGDAVLNEKNVANAIAGFLQTLTSYNAPFDQYMRGKKSGISQNAIRGFNLFAGKAKCATCHYMPLFNGSKPPLYYYQESEVIGVPATTDTVHPVLDGDPGRINSLPFDFLNHAFKTPTLRNIELTAPYMHNGVYATLEEVIDFYDKGGGHGLGLAVPNQTLPAEQLGLTPIEKKQLKAFLLTLTDTSGNTAASKPVARRCYTHQPEKKTLPRL